MMNKKIIEILEKLISCKSLTPKDDDCQKYIAEFLEKLGFKIEFKNNSKILLPAFNL